MTPSWGFDAELAALLSQKTGLTLQLVDTKFSSLILGLSGGRQDAVISALYITEERTRQADAIPYANTGPILWCAATVPLRRKRNTISVGSPSDYSRGPHG
ncbi:Probable ABC transporter arginine-binding protein ArtJ precursor [Raoultella planticola]|uniref:Probable ABC transporter arginine-binding protein ArtJ n=1 Tax=Raoultella planticola TaxID=575 RepID=A0A485BVR6_RAOPL|nr:Probable ABC transporter arginine-binding protein ArtJ precursor [Raoultella planticola]